ncbi:MAG: YncE family protein [Candidatus Saccharibacteria bacterium]|nr:YncE family protein [Candidatus Saccharibacteria bacterium]
MDVTVDGALAGTADPGAGTTWSLAIPHVTAGSHTISAQMKQKRQYAYMTNRGFGTIDVVDVISKSYVHEINGPDTYYASIFNARNNKMYAASQWNGKCAIKMFNATTFAIENSIAMSADGSYPIGLALDPAGNKLYEVCNDGNGGYNVIVYDTNTHAPTGSFDLGLEPGDFPSGIAIDPTNTSIWVRYNRGIKTFNVSDLNNAQNIELNPSGLATNNIVFNQDGSKVYTADSDSNLLYSFNTSNLSGNSVQINSNLTNLAFTPDFSKLYGISSFTSSVYVLDPSTLEVLDEQTTEQPPESLAITGDGLNFVVGDDHGSGQIYFGATSGNAIVTDTITAPNGGSYYTSTGNFIAPPHYGVLGEATSVAVSVKAAAIVPNTGFARK